MLIRKETNTVKYGKNCSLRLPVDSNLDYLAKTMVERVIPLCTLQLPSIYINISST